MAARSRAATLSALRVVDWPFRSRAREPTRGRQQEGVAAVPGCLHAQACASRMGCRWQILLSTPHARTRRTRGRMAGGLLNPLWIIVVLCASRDCRQRRAVAHVAARAPWL